MTTKTAKDIRKKIKEACEQIQQEPETMTWSQAQICEVCDGVKEMLLEKNRRYGDSALAPVRVFSHADPEEAIRVRIDDKLSRLCHERDDEDEDVVNDLIGYLVLLKVAKLRNTYADSVPGPDMAVI